MATGIARNGPCICGSGKRFKQCCGQIDAPHWNKAAIGRLEGSILSAKFAHLIEHEPTCVLDGETLPPGVFAKPLSDRYSWRTIASALTATQKDHSAEVTGASGSQRFHPQRVTTLVDQGRWAQGVKDLVKQAYREEVEPFYSCTIKWFEAPHAWYRYPVSSLLKRQHLMNLSNGRHWGGCKPRLGDTSGQETTDAPA